MGCDIHAHLEILWEEDDFKGWLYYAPVSIGRNYDLFARMANVRNYREIEPIAPARGLPKNMSKTTEVHANEWGVDGHSHSWLTVEELCQVISEQPDNRIEPRLSSGNFADYPWMTEFPRLYLFGGSICGFLKYPDERPEGLKNVRLVFWFDN